MSKVEVSPPVARGTRRPAKVNALYAAIEAAGASGWNAANFAEEGLARRALVSQVAVEQAFDPIEETTRVSIPITMLWATFTPNGTSFLAGPIELEANDLLVLRARVQLETTRTAGMGIGNGTDTTTMQFRFATNDGAVAGVTGSKRTLYTVKGHAWVDVLGVVPGPASLTDVRLQYSMFGPGVGGADGVAYPSKSIMYGAVHRRVETS